MKKSILALALTAITLFSTSCATMFSGTRYTANISATKPGSEIYVDGKHKGTDKTSVVIKRKTEPVIEVKHSDKTDELKLHRSIKWGSQVANLLNWIYFIPVGTIIDASNGAIYQPEHNTIPEVTKVNNKVFNVVIDNARD